MTKEEINSPIRVVPTEQNHSNQNPCFTEHHSTAHSQTTESDHRSPARPQSQTTHPQVLEIDSDSEGEIGSDSERLRHRSHSNPVSRTDLAPWNSGEQIVRSLDTKGGKLMHEQMKNKIDMEQMRKGMEQINPVSPPVSDSERLSNVNSSPPVSDLERLSNVNSNPVSPPPRAIPQYLAWRFQQNSGEQIVRSLDTKGGKLMHEQMKNNTKKKNESDMEQMRKDMEQMRKDMEQMRSDMEQMRKDMKQIRKDMKQMEQMRKDMEQMRKEMEQMRKDMEQMRKEMEQMRKDMEQMRKEMEQMRKDMEQMRKEMEQMRKDMEQMEQMEQMRKEMEHVRKDNMEQMEQMRKEMEQMRKDMEQMRNDMERLADEQSGKIGNIIAQIPQTRNQEEEEKMDELTDKIDQNSGSWMENMEKVEAAISEKLLKNFIGAAVFMGMFYTASNYLNLSDYQGELSLGLVEGCVGITVLAVILHSVISFLGSIRMLNILIREGDSWLEVIKERDSGLNGEDNAVQSKSTHIQNMISSITKNRFQHRVYTISLGIFSLIAYILVLVSFILMCMSINSHYKVHYKVQAANWGNSRVLNCSLLQAGNLGTVLVTLGNGTT